jgi:tRNA threonylcarbamoyladenosine modification (KEOPS) complex Cgi121 subunit/molybdopterin converting factor small subunit
MITIKLVGGAKKSFSTDTLKVEKSDISIQDLLDLLLELKPLNTPKLDVENVLIAINGIDSSALDGKMTKIKNDDVVNIIPIIHGGSSNRLFFNISKKLIQVIEIQSQKEINTKYIDELRKKYPKLKLQAISSDFILNPYHLRKILGISVYSDESNNLLSNKFEIDILMRFAITSQISEAIKRVGIKQKQKFILISMGNREQLDSLYSELSDISIQMFSKNNNSFLKKYFKINNKQLNTISTKNSLSDLLVEKAAILF